MKFPKISSVTKKIATGGAIAGAIVGLESGMSWFVAGYPDFLKTKIVPQLPRNGALIADLGPAGIAYYLKKKKPKYDNMANGMLFYDLPKLLDQILYSVAYTAGGGLRLGMSRMVSQPLRLNIRPNNSFAPKPFVSQAVSGQGKYTLKTNSTRPAVMGGTGKYGKY